MEETIKKPCSGEERGRRFKEIRLEKGLSQRKLAEITKGVSASTIANLEKGADISAIKFLRLCLALNIENPDELIYE